MMTDLPAPDDAEAIHAYAASFDGYAPGREGEDMMEVARRRRRATTTDLRAELFLAERAMHFGAMPVVNAPDATGERESDEVVRLYGELYPVLSGEAPVWIEYQHRVFRAAFLSSRNEEDHPWRPYYPRRWVEQVGAPSHSSVPERGPGRKGLKRLLAQIDDAEVAAALVLAWGGMRRDPEHSVFSSKDREWVDVVRAMRNGRYSRVEAYAAFHELSIAKKLPGMGPAYYTKLIFFLRPADPNGEGRGYIMDQWTARSINLLFGEKLVAIQNKVWVKPSNDALVYEAFNRRIEHIARHWREDAENVELALFGRGGKRRDAWRAHVLRSTSDVEQAGDRPDVVT